MLSIATGNAAEDYSARVGMGLVKLSNDYSNLQLILHFKVQVQLIVQDWNHLLQN